ncbi:hypothetical protein B0I32_12762 [Nonomuraea fuscirosea]|uniref:Uncharacterized protein n=1 Tax=Nonomuraea fuscirosea TaxID=1291556 RepID=A0A2T0M7N7_9ACTN|nr:hypothetical protein B0I32_12762 [Nonomuraea fuscirosea]
MAGVGDDADVAAKREIIRTMADIRISLAAAWA